MSPRLLLGAGLVLPMASACRARFLCRAQLVLSSRALSLSSSGSDSVFSRSRPASQPVMAAEIASSRAASYFTA